MKVFVATTEDAEIIGVFKTDRAAINGCAEDSGLNSREFTVKRFDVMITIQAGSTAFYIEIHELEG